MAAAVACGSAYVVLNVLQQGSAKYSSKKYLCSLEMASIKPSNKGLIIGVPNYLAASFGPKGGIIPAAHLKTSSACSPKKRMLEQLKELAI